MGNMGQRPVSVYSDCTQNVWHVGRFPSGEESFSAHGSFVHPQEVHSPHVTNYIPAKRQQTDKSKHIGLTICKNQQAI